MIKLAKSRQEVVSSMIVKEFWHLSYLLCVCVCVSVGVDTMWGHVAASK